MRVLMYIYAHVCGQEEDIDPSAYNPLPATPTSLLSLIYRHLMDHLERSSPRSVIGMLAYMLTTNSRGYLQDLCASVGYNTPGSRSSALPVKEQMRSDGTERLYAGQADDDDNGEVNADEDRGGDPDGYPEFITAEVAEVYSRARKSLVLLRAADPEHPLLKSNYVHPAIEWLWTEEQLDNMENGLSFGAAPARKTTGGPEGTATSHSVADVMRAFKVFDLLPGEPGPGTNADLATSASANLLSGAHSTATLRAFLASFPPTLPPSTPTLSHLTARVLYPLVTHAQALSGALVARFLAPNTHLHLHTHLVLLRGYILVTAPTFKARLQDALFSDAEDVSAPVVGSRTYAASEARENARERTRTKSRSRSRAASGAGHEQTKEQEKVKKARRAVGLSPALIIGDKWPPLGSDLNFLLRTVIVDALDAGRFTHKDEDESMDEDDQRRARQRIIEEAEWRLGFAIRDLPIGSGREKWLNPLCKFPFDSPLLPTR